MLVPSAKFEPRPNPDECGQIATWSVLSELGLASIRARCERFDAAGLAGLLPIPDTSSAALRAKTAGLDPSMRLEHWNDSAAVTYDHAMWDELCSLRFVEAAHNVVIMGPVGVGKTFLATALGHACVRRRYSVHFERTDRLLKRLKVSRLDNSHDAEVRKLLRVDVLILDDFGLQALDALDTADIYELIVERHRRAATVTTSNREPIEWLNLMADALLAQSAIDRLQSAAHELVLDGQSYRQRQKPTVGEARS